MQPFKIFIENSEEEKNFVNWGKQWADMNVSGAFKIHILKAQILLAHSFLNNKINIPQQNGW